MDSLEWIGHASFLVKDNGKRIFIDPFDLRKDFGKADVIFITHPHFDHFSVDDIKKIATLDTSIICPGECVNKLDYGNVHAVKPFESGSASGVDYRTIPAYNNVLSRIHAHPKENGWVGYIIKFGKSSLYHAGDTDFIEDMAGVEVNNALIPMGGTYVMDVDDAIKASHTINADRVSPMHYKMLLHEKGSWDAEMKFSKNVENALILKEAQEAKYSF
jgi:L-ascorbate metabolism protein UlaG (beta-lactamase superfamily)